MYWQNKNKQKTDKSFLNLQGLPFGLLNSRLPQNINNNP